MDKSTIALFSQDQTIAGIVAPDGHMMPDVAEILAIQLQAAGPDGRQGAQQRGENLRGRQLAGRGPRTQVGLCTHAGERSVLILIQSKSVNPFSNRFV